MGEIGIENCIYGRMGKWIERDMMMQKNQQSNASFSSTYWRSV